MSAELAKTRERPAAEAAQAPRLEVESATTARRLVAFLIDSLPLLTLWGLLVAATIDTSSIPPSRWNLLDRMVDTINAQPSILTLSVVIGALVAVAWYVLTSRLWGQTPGKRVMGLVVVDASGERPSAARTLAHAVLRVLSVGLLFAGHLWAIADPTRRTLYDRLAGLWVIRDPSRGSSAEG